MKIYIDYAGCKVNQFEKSLLEERFLEKGFMIVEDYESADIVVYNTCCVTKKAESGCRQKIRKIAKVNNKVQIVLTGCYAHKDRERLKRLPNVFSIIDNEKKFSIPEMLLGSETFESLSLNFEYKRIFKDRERSFLKIQDGCDSFCSYCIVPFVRGKPVSMQKELVIKNLSNLSNEKEVVLTGIHLGKWGLDIGYSLKNLLRDIGKENFNFRLRLSSLEPLEIDKDLLEVLKDLENFCPHFHIPLQSGSDRVLKLMKRNYTKAQYKEKIELIRDFFPLAGIGLDIIIGFPTETEDDFLETKAFLESLPVDYMHIFRYSDREGTVSYSINPKVDENIKEERTELLRNIDRTKRDGFAKRFLNREVKCLFERKEKGMNRFLTREYLKVYSTEIEEKKEFTAKLVKLKPPTISLSLK